MIDEKELTEISAVIELTKWVKDGNVIPHFLWCLRDFMLDYKQYKDPNDYLENVISTRDMDPDTDKYKIRKNFGEFFKDRGCMFFVRPVNDEKKLREIEKLKPSELRPEFNKSVEEFKHNISSHVKPKRFNDRILNGTAFVKLIKDILDAFNSQKIPEIASSVERIIESERREVLDQMKKSANDYIKANIDTEPDIVRKGVQRLWNELFELSIKKQDNEICSKIFGDLLKFFYMRVEQEKMGRHQKSLKDVDYELGDHLSDPEFKMSALFERLKAMFDAKKLTDQDVSARFILEKIIGKICMKGSSIIHDLERNYKYELEEKDKDIEAEKEKKKYVNNLLKEQKQSLAEYQRKIQNMEQSVKTKNSEIATLKSLDNRNDQALLNQLSIDKEKIAKLERENRDLSEVS